MEERITRVSLAVQMKVEGALPLPPGMEVTAEVGGRRFDAMSWRAGLFVFLDLSAGTYTVRTRSVECLDDMRVVSVPLADPRIPILRIAVKPSWRYPFGDASTLLRGRVEAGGDAVEGASVVLEGSTLSSRTGADGRFVLCFTGLKPQNVTASGFVKAQDGGTNFQLKVNHPGHREAVQAVQDIAEARSRTLAAPIVLASL